MKDRNDGKTPGFFRRGLIVANTALAWAMVFYLALIGREGLIAAALAEGAYLVIGGGVAIYAGSAYFEDRLKKAQKKPPGVAE